MGGIFQGISFDSIKSSHYLWLEQTVSNVYWKTRKEGSLFEHDTLIVPAPTAILISISKRVCKNVTHNCSCRVKK